MPPRRLEEEGAAPKKNSEEDNLKARLLGIMANKYAYGIFGQVIDEEEQVENHFKYVGAFGVMDEGNGLYYMRARYYDPEVGRFISKDPIGLEGGINLYAYVGGNPLNYIDPLGLTPGQPPIDPYPDPGQNWNPSARPRYFCENGECGGKRRPLSQRTKCLIALKVAFTLPCGAGGYGIGVAATPSAGWKAFSICNWYFTLLSYQICPDDEPEDASCSGK
jgi:RHS repeat-associated protein